MTALGRRAYKGLAKTHCSEPQLKQRGWTDRLIDDFLGQPDVLAENPNDPTETTRFFENDRVDRMEESVPKVWDAIAEATNKSWIKEVEDGGGKCEPDDPLPCLLFADAERNKSNAVTAIRRIKGLAAQLGGLRSLKALVDVLSE